MSEGAKSGRIKAGDLLWLAAGFALWFSALAFLYGVHALGCAFGWSAEAVRVTLIGILLLHLAVIGVLWRVRARQQAIAGVGRQGVFVHWLIVGTLAAAFVKTVLMFAPVLVLTVCT